MEKDKRYVLAILMNAFALPGAGYFLIGEKIRGILISVLSVLFLTAASVQYGLAVVKRLSMMIPDDVGASATSIALYEAWQINRNAIFLYIAAMALLWIYCLIDVMLKRKKFRSIIIGG